MCRTLVETMIMTKICFACVHTVSFRSTSLGLKMHNPFGSGRGGEKKAAGGGGGAGGGGTMRIKNTCDRKGANSSAVPREWLQYSWMHFAFIRGCILRSCKGLRGQSCSRSYSIPGHSSS